QARNCCPARGNPYSATAISDREFGKPHRSKNSIESHIAKVENYKLPRRYTGGSWANRKTANDYGSMILSPNCNFPGRADHNPIWINAPLAIIGTVNFDPMMNVANDV